MLKEEIKNIIFNDLSQNKFFIYVLYAYITVLPLMVAEFNGGVIYSVIILIIHSFLIKARLINILNIKNLIIHLVPFIILFTLFLLGFGIGYIVGIELLLMLIPGKKTNLIIEDKLDEKSKGNKIRTNTKSIILIKIIFILFFLLPPFGLFLIFGLARNRNGDLSLFLIGRTIILLLVIFVILTGRLPKILVFILKNKFFWLIILLYIIVLLVMNGLYFLDRNKFITEYKYKYIYEIVYSEDSKNIGFIGANYGIGKNIIINGKEITINKDYNNISNLILKGNNFVYIGEKDGKYMIVKNGIEKEIPTNKSHINKKAYIKKIAFSDDLEHYICLFEFSYGNNYLIKDGDFIGSFYSHLNDKSFIFSPDLNHYVYIKSKKNGQILVEDGIETTNYYDNIELLTFSPDSKHFAYIAEKNGKQIIVKDGIEEKIQAKDGSNHISTYHLKISFSPDGRKIFFNNIENFFKNNKYIHIHNVVLSPNGESVTYIGRKYIDLLFDKIPIGNGILITEKLNKK